jgi:hypothetical protein
MNTELWQAIFLTLNYFNLFDYPLKKEEIWQWLWRVDRGESNESEGHEMLDLAREEGLVAEQGGFYFLPGREKIVMVRRERERISLLKIKKAF